MLKSFIQTFVLYNVMERVVLASWFDITIELDGESSPHQGTKVLLVGLISQ
jgi:hypothetical protein